MSCSTMKKGFKSRQRFFYFKARFSWKIIKHNHGKAKNQFSFYIRVFENMFSTNLKAFSDSLERPKDKPLAGVGNCLHIHF